VPAAGPVRPPAQPGLCVRERPHCRRRYSPVPAAWLVLVHDSPGLAHICAGTRVAACVHGTSSLCRRMHQAPGYSLPCYSTLLAYHPIPALPYSEYPRTAPSFGACACAGPRAAADHALDAALGRGVRRCCAPCSRARSRCRHASWLVCRRHRKGKIYCNWPAGVVFK